MYQENAQERRDIVVIDEEDPVEAVQPILRSAALPRRDGNGQVTERQSPPREPIPADVLQPVSSTPEKGVVVTSAEISSLPDPRAAYYETGSRQPRMTQDELFWSVGPSQKHLPFRTHISVKDKVLDTQHISEPLGTDSGSHVTFRGSNDIVTIDLDVDDEADFPTSMVDLVVEDDYQGQICSPTSNTSVQSLGSMYETVEQFSSDNRTLRAGKTVEMLDREFLHIRSINRDITTTEIFLQGHRLRRTKDLEGILELKLNEVVMILDVEETDPRAVMAQGLEQVPLAQVGRIRNLVITNKPFPELSFRENPHEWRTNEEIASNARLVCRWQYIRSFPTPQHKSAGKFSEKCLTRFEQKDIDSSNAMSDDMLRRYWRGDTVKGGACLHMPAQEEEFDKKERVTRHASERIRPNISRQYSEWPATSSSSPNGSHSYPFPVPEHDMETSVSPFAPENQSRAAQSQIIIDMTNDESPTVSLISLSLSESRGQPPERHDSSDMKTPQPSWQHNSQSQGIGAIPSSQRTSSPDLIEISSKIAAKSATGGETTKCIGASPSNRLPCPSTVKRLKTSPREITLSLMTPEDWSAEFTRQQSGKLWSIDSMAPSQKVASATVREWIPSLITGHEEGGQKTSARATAFPTRRRKRSLEQRTPSEQDSTSTQPRQKQRYTFGDAFCGAGGASRGAKSAGFRVEWGFDFDFAAIESYRLNFYNAQCIVAWAHHFVELTVGDENKVDILHISPPCQVFSWAHTVNGKDDEMNSATFFAVEELVKRTKPRVVTLENTSGLAILHPLWLNKAIQFFTGLGFSIRWKIMNFAEYGLPQARKRLIIFASCPGEGLPVFPNPTHGVPQSGLAPLVTVQDVISRIPRGFANHDPASVRERNEPFYPADKPLRSCITTCGGGNYHPLGNRDFTLREYACLQGFPLEHKFGRIRVKKQIGNAVPPSIAKVLFEEIKKSLLKADGFWR